MEPRHMFMAEIDTESSDNLTVMFPHIRDDDNQLPTDIEMILISRDTWEQLGRPVQITVTVQPGNKINVPG